MRIAVQRIIIARYARRRLGPPWGSAGDSSEAIREMSAGRTRLRSSLWLWWPEHLYVPWIEEPDSCQKM